jgi:hypothetical protein
MTHDPHAELQVLAEKLQDKEKLELADFTGFYNAVRRALADGKLGIFEVIGLVKQFTDLLSEISGAFQGGGSPQPDFGFLRQAPTPEA